MLRSIALLIALLVSTAQAQDLAAPRLKAQVLVRDEIVRIGDLVDRAGELAAIPVFRAPDLGHTGSVSARRIRDAVAAHGMHLEAADVSAVSVTRESRVFTRQQIEERIAAAISAQDAPKEPRNLSLTFDREVRSLYAEPSLDFDLDVSHMRYDSRSGRFDVSLDIPGSAVGRRTALRFTGVATETVPVIVLNRTLARGDIVADDDVKLERRPATGLGSNVPSSTETVVGLAARRALREGDVLRTSDVMKPEVVQRNEAVLIAFEAPGLMITVRGKALQSGAEGDIVNVVNIQSKRAVQAVVTGPARVTVSAAIQNGDATGAISASARPRTRTE